MIIDAGVNGLWGFMWFVCFCYTADQWRRVDGENNFDTSTVNCARSGVAFSFFCILIWVSVCVCGGGGGGLCVCERMGNSLI